ncbi:MAG: DMT family transporter [Suipraeoptans sp.]
MYQFFSLFTGMILAFMVSANGSLTENYDALFAAVIIHIVGVAFATIIYIFKKEKKPFIGHYPLWFYLGGAVGVLTTVFTNFAYESISVTSIVALALFGQTVTALFIDTFGLFGMKKHSFNRATLIGFAFSIFGIILMLDNTVTKTIFAVLFAFGSGISVVLSRTINSKLSDKIGALQGSLVNHAVGLPITIVLAFLFGSSFVINTASLTSSPWIYTGGIMGVIVVLLSNIIVPKVSAFKVTVLMFVGQLFTGIGIDIFLGNDFMDKSFIGGITISAGIIINLIIEYFSNKKLQ